MLRNQIFSKFSGYSKRSLIHNKLFSSKVNTNYNHNHNLFWTTNKVRETFINYFVNNQQHQFIPSSSVVPYNDDSLLFTNAGMNQFKSIFLGTVDPKSPFSSLKRVVNSQKCIRAGGKHNDLADVGKDTYHHTFFEMLGTWSFGNYFKKEAIEWAFDILINKYKLDKERMYVSYFAGDESLGIPCDIEARDLWLKYLPPHRVLPFGSKENFWEMGETGPCGPCSEIHYDLIGNRDASTLVNKDDPTVLEIWNLVFIQFHRDLIPGSTSNTTLKTLPSQHVDTGMGLERITSILQNKTSNYDIDIFQPIFDHIYEHTKATGTPPYQGKLGHEDARNGFKDMAYRAIADHIRALCIAIADGAIPSNEKRGYVLRRILRRAFRHGLVLNTPPEYLSSLVPTVIQTLSVPYPELLEKQAYIQTLINEEEKAFSAVLPHGLKYLNEVLTLEEKNISLKNELSGSHAFYLYDTLGFPIDLTQLILEEKGYTINMNEFDELMREQKKKSKDISSKKQLEEDYYSTIKIGVDQIAMLQSAEIPPTNDEWKYSHSDSTSHPLSSAIQAVVTSTGEIILHPSHLPLSSDKNYIHCGIILNQTSFYSESGGQIADTGNINIQLTNGNTLELNVIDVQTCGPYVIHTCSQQLSQLSPPFIQTSTIDLLPQSTVTCVVNSHRRHAISSNHTFTHLLNYALRKFSHLIQFFQLIKKALTRSEIESIEQLINSLIQQSLEVFTSYINLQNISQIHGLRAVFGETYPDPVRVVSIGSTLDDILTSSSNDHNTTTTTNTDISIELCGGNHLQNTSEALLFKIIEEISTARGIRRITAVTREEALLTQVNSQQFKQLLLNYQKELTSLHEKQQNQQINTYDLINFSTKLSTLHQQLTSQLLSYSDRLDRLFEFNELKKTYSNLMKQYITEDINQIMKRLIEQGKNTLQVRHQNFDIFFISKNQQLNSASTTVATVGTTENFYQLSDQIYLKRMTNELNEQFQNQLSYLLILEEKEKITCYCVVQDNARERGISAREWIDEIMKEFHGKGGGKINIANGSLKNNEEENSKQVDQLMEYSSQMVRRYEMKFRGGVEASK